MCLLYWHLYFFILLWVTVQCPFISTCRVPFRISLQGRPSGKGLLSFCLFGNFLILLLGKIILLDRRILVDRCFSPFLNFEYISPLPLVSEVSDEKSVDNLIGGSLVWDKVASLLLHARFSLCLWLSSVWFYCASVCICLSSFCLEFIELLDVYMHTFLSNLGNFRPVFLQIISLPLLHSLQRAKKVYPKCVCCLTCWYPQFLGYVYYSSIFFLLLLRLNNFSLSYLQVYILLPAQIFLWVPLVNFYFSNYTFLALEFLFDLFLGFLFTDISISFIHYFPDFSTHLPLVIWESIILKYCLLGLSSGLSGTVSIGFFFSLSDTELFMIFWLKIGHLSVMIGNSGNQICWVLFFQIYLGITEKIVELSIQHDDFVYIYIAIRLSHHIN